jgi:RHS repeat-associated protein
VEIYTIALDESGLIAASEPSKVEGPAYGTGRKGSIEWQGSDLYWNQYGLYSDIGQDKIFARVLKTGQTQPVSSGEYGDLRFSGDNVYKLGQAGTSLKTASATAAADDRPGYLPGQPWRASGTGPQLSYRRKGIRQYELTDHLGNVRAVIGDRLEEKTDEDNQTAYAPELLSATDYFPFGMQMPGRVYSASEGYRFGFNGMERENAVNEVGYDFGARLYNSWNGKFLSIDPYSAKFPSESNYIFAGNNPVYFIDVKGKYKICPELRKHYPEIALYISKNIEADMKRRSISELFIERTGISETDYAEMIKPNSGPTIAFFIGFGIGHNGKYENHDKTISINKGLFDLYNDATSLEEKEMIYI